MVKLVAVYRKPDDTKAFDEHYFKTHLPLAKKMPGLVRWEVDRGSGSPMPDAEYPYLTAHLYFDNQRALDAAMKSEQGKAAAKDVMGFAGKYVKMYFAEVIEGAEGI